MRVGDIEIEGDGERQNDGLVNVVPRSAPTSIDKDLVQLGGRVGQ